jgi:hypothetical protein
VRSESIRVLEGGDALWHNRELHLLDDGPSFAAIIEKLTMPHGAC